MVHREICYSWKNGSKSEMRLTDRKMLDSQKNVSRLDEGSHIEKYVTVRKMGPD